MKFPIVNALFAVIFGALSVFTMGGLSLPRARADHHATSGSTLAELTIDYPLDGSVFPPEITPPTFLFRDSDDAAKRWIVQVTFADHSPVIHVDAAGEHFHVGQIDTQASTPDQLFDLTPQQQATRMWKPDAVTWDAIKQRSVKSPVTIFITGFADDDSNLPTSAGSVKISTSIDAVGAPVFYRDVPLMLVSPNEKGAIQPLPKSALPLIKWRLRYIGEPDSRIVMENLPTCANCHSFSLDGKTLGLDLDGPRNDKGLYALLPVSKEMTIRNQDVIRWSSFQENPGVNKNEPSVKRFGIMSQVSPNGRFVVTSIAPPSTSRTNQGDDFRFVSSLSDRLFSINYRSIQ